MVKKTIGGMITDTTTVPRPVSADPWPVVERLTRDEVERIRL
jgi:hypothetical protein